MKTHFFLIAGLALALIPSPSQADERPLEELSKAELILKIRNMQSAERREGQALQVAMAPAVPAAIALLNEFYHVDLPDTPKRSEKCVAADEALEGLLVSLWDSNVGGARIIAAARLEQKKEVLEWIHTARMLLDIFTDQRKKIEAAVPKLAPAAKYMGWNEPQK